MFEQFIFVHVGLLHSEDEEQKKVHRIKHVLIIYIQWNVECSCTLRCTIKYYSILYGGEK